MKKNLLLLSLFIFSSSLYAVGSSDKSSGCGLGWEVTDKMSLSASSTRGTTNATASNTFGMSSGTSGCEQHGLVKNESERIYFSEANVENLVAEMSMGEGEFLSAFAKTLGCNVSEFSKLTQKNYTNIVTEKTNGKVLLDNVYKVIKNNNLNCLI